MEGEVYPSLFSSFAESLGDVKISPATQELSRQVSIKCTTASVACTGGTTVFS
jgi:hypothetical protein